jgi:hypothetical protein
MIRKYHRKYLKKLDNFFQDTRKLLSKGVVGGVQILKANFYSTIGRMEMGKSLT